MKLNEKKNVFTLGYTLLLLGFSCYVLLDSFVITHVYSVVPSAREALASIPAAEESMAENMDEITADEKEEPDTANARGEKKREKGIGEEKKTPPSKTEQTKRNKPGGSEKSGTDDSDTGSKLAGTSLDGKSVSTENYTIRISEYRENDTTVYVADIVLKDSSALKTAFAQNAYGKNVTAKTSDTAEEVGAVLAINGDYYGAREKGYVIRNSVLYRDTAAKSQEDLVIYQDGSFEIIQESEVSAETLLENGAYQVLSFGPALVVDGGVSVTEADEVGKAKASNPRTAIGILGENHYVFVVSDGRTEESEGLSLLELAEFMKGLGCETAYNLDGGGSSTLYFDGEIVNKPTTSGSIQERSVSDIVYIGK